MTQNEIMEIARQAGFPFNKYGLLQGDDEGEINADEMFEAFAKLVAAKEREECAKLVEVPDDADDWMIGGYQGRELLNEIASEIRARGEA